MTKQFTERQQQYIDAIVAANLAEREEVEAAFRDRSGDGARKIDSWGAHLRKQREEARQVSLRPRYESCAYPGCDRKIQVEKLNAWTESPKPSRWLSLTVQVEGWHMEGFSRVDNTRTIKKALYGCPEHQAQIFSLEFDLVPVLPPVGGVAQEAEPRIQYPLENHESHWKLIELARNTALDLVAQTERYEDLAHIHRTIRPRAEQQLEALIAVSDLSTLTDNLEQFRAMYLEEFVEGYLEGVRIRKTIEFGRSSRYRDEKRWQQFLERKRLFTPDV